MHILVMPRPLARQLLSHINRAPPHTAWCRVGVGDLGADRVWLARDVLQTPPSHTETTTPRSCLWQVRLGTRPLSPRDTLEHSSTPGSAGTLLLGDGRLRGSAWGVVHTAQGHAALDALHLVGPGMHRLGLSQPATAAHPTHQTLSLPGYTPFLAPTTVWSRTIGALGGEAVWQRLVGLRVAVIGVGRTGSLIATTLARVGLTQVTLIDPDEIEPHNLGEMDSVRLTDLQRHKVDAVAATLRGDIALPYHALAVPVTADTARRACLQADVLICCVDNDAARLATAIVATLYHKVLLDLGTGIALQPATDDASAPPERIMGADVRLILPGDGCLLCRGQLTNLSQAVDDLQHQRPLGRPQAWQTQRAGSLRTLNQLAAALGVQLLQDLVAERVQETTWAHLTFDPHGRLTVQYPPAPAPHAAAPCVLCTRAGLGDAGWAWVV